MSSQKKNHQRVQKFEIESFINEPIQSIPIKDKSGKLKFNWTKSECKYSYPNGEKDIFLIQGPRVFCYNGFAPQWPLNVDEDERTDDNISGWQVMSSIHKHDETDAKKLKEAREFMDICDQIHDKTYNFIMSPEQLSKVPRGQALLLKEGPNGLKPIYSPAGEVKDKKNPGKMKEVGPSLTPKLLWDKKTNTFNTIVRDSTGRVSPLKYKGVAGEMQPIYWVDNVYFGGHGETEHGASFQLKLWMCNYYPSSNNNPTPSDEDEDMLPPVEGSAEEAPEADIPYEGNPPPENVNMTSTLENMTVNEEVEIEETKVKKPNRRKVNKGQ